MDAAAFESWTGNLQGFLESAPDAMIVVNAHGEIFLVNSQTELLFGYKKNELLGQKIEILVPKRFGAIHVRHRSGFLSAPKTRSMGTGKELYGVRKDGKEFPVEISLSPISSPHGVFISSAVRDTTDRRRAEQKFRSLLESAPDAMVIVDSHGSIVLVNAQTERLFGYKREDLLGKKVEAIVPERFRSSHLVFRDGFTRHPKSRAMGVGRELYGLRSDGSEFPVEISLSPIETDEGILIASAIRDISVQKQLEHELQEASRMKSEFLANMSHELRTPLNGIIGFSEFLADQKPGPLNGKQREYLNDILNNGNHLLQLINDVLDLSKVEAGKMELCPESFSLSKALDEVRQTIIQMAEKKGVEIQLEIDHTVQTVTLDQQKFKQVLFNLLSNAVKFTNRGGKVTIVAMPHGDFGISVRVVDTGIGIRADDFDRLFVEFQQLDSSLARNYQGTGLGLALVKKMVEAQRGRVFVESEVGKGSIFTVELPFSTQEKL